MTHSPPAGLAATEPSTSEESSAQEEPAILALPVGLQKTIVEYVSGVRLASRSNFKAHTARSAARRPVQSFDEAAS